MNDIWWNQNKVNIDNGFVYNIALKMVNDNKDRESKSTKDGKHSENWPKWTYLIEEELNLLYKWFDFGFVVQTIQDVKPIEYNWVFVKKKNKNGEIMR